MRLVARNINTFYKKYSSAYMSHPNGAGLSDSEYRVWDIIDRLFKQKYDGSDNILVYNTTAMAIADISGMSVKTIREKSQILVKKGFLVKLGANGSSQYWLTLDPSDKKHARLVNAINKYNGFEVTRQDLALQAEYEQKVENVPLPPKPKHIWSVDNTIDLDIKDEREFEGVIAIRRNKLIWVKGKVLSRFMPSKVFDPEDVFIINNPSTVDNGQKEYCCKELQNNKDARDKLRYYINGLINTEQHVIRLGDHND